MHQCNVAEFALVNRECDYAHTYMFGFLKGGAVAALFCIRMDVNVFSVRKLLVMSAAHGILFLMVLQWALKSP